MQTRIIPSNYNSMDGKTRNIVETIILDGIYMLFIHCLNLPFKYDMYIALGMIPITVFGIMGIGGQSLGTALNNYIRFVRKKRILAEPSQEYIREKNKAKMLKNTKNGIKKGGNVIGK